MTKIINLTGSQPCAGNIGTEGILSSFLAGRTFNAAVKDQSSGVKFIKAGLPEGNNHGLVLYTADLPNETAGGNVCVTAFLASHESLQAASRNLDLGGPTSQHQEQNA